MPQSPNDHPPGPSELPVRPLMTAVFVCVGFIVMSSVLGAIVGEADAAWYEALVQPDLPRPPDVLLILLILAFYPVFGFVLHRALSWPAEVAERRTVVGLVVAALAIQVSWNPLLIGTRSLVAGVAGNVALLGVLLAMAVLLWRRNRLPALLVVPFLLLTLHDLAWSWELLRLNP